MQCGALTRHYSMFKDPLFTLHPHHHTQRAAEDSTEKRTKDTYGPPMGKRLIMFIDDLNMPRVDLYGA